MNALPANWRAASTAKLNAWMDSPFADQHPDYDDVVEEVSERYAQAAADRGEMNGRAPR